MKTTKKRNTKQVKRWIAFFVDSGNHLAVYGYGMTPDLFKTEKEALARLEIHKNTGAIVQIIIPKGVKV